MGEQTSGSGSTFTEKIQVAGHELVDRVKELVAEGDVRQVTVRNEAGKKLLTVPMNLGVAAGGIAVLAAPTLVVLGGIAGLLANVTLEVQRTDVVDVDATVIEVNPDSDSAQD